MQLLEHVPFLIISGLVSICQPGQACNVKPRVTTHGSRVESPDWDRYLPAYLPTYLLCVERNEVLLCSWWHLIYTLYWLKVDAYVCSMYSWALLGPLASEFWIIDILVNDGYWSLSKCTDNFILPKLSLMSFSLWALLWPCNLCLGWNHTLHVKISKSPPPAPTKALN
jgi:hypothetical protein